MLQLCEMLTMNRMKSLQTLVVSKTSSSQGYSNDNILSITIHFLSMHFFDHCLAAFLTQTICIDDTTVKFEIWDTAGQERYHSLAPMYYRGAQAAIIVYDITSQVSFRLHTRSIVLYLLQ